MDGRRSALVPGLLGLSAAFGLFFYGIAGCGSGHKVTTQATASPEGGAATAPMPPATPQLVFSMDPFDVPPGSELYECQDLPNPLDRDVAIVKSESTVTLGSHHMFAFRIPADGASFAPDGTKGPIFDCPQGGLEFHPYFHLTQRAHDVTVYPPGVGRPLNASDAIRMNIHFLNAGAAPITASGEVTVSYVDPSTISELAAEVFLASYSLHVPVGRSTQTFSYFVTNDMKMLQVNGHMHSRGTHFEAEVVAADDAGTRPFYTTDTWNEPLSEAFDPAFPINAGERIRWSCTFQNDTDASFAYGQSADTNEMCNIFGVLYPSPDGGATLSAQ
jgi:hypothetical protein